VSPCRLEHRRRRLSQTSLSLARGSNTRGFKTRGFKTRGSNAAFRLVAGVLLGAIALTVAGCGTDTSSDQDDFAAVRDRVLIDTMPDDAVTIESVQDDTAGETPLTLLGKIDAGEFDAFEPDRAAFLIRDVIEDELKDPEHDVSECPFCKRKAAQAARAHVVIVDEKGDPMKTPVPELLGLAKGDRVVVRGTGRWDESLGMLMVQATGVHVAR